MRKVISILGVAVMVFSLSACAETPEQSLVAQKNNERLIEAAKEEPDEEKTLKSVADLTQEFYDFSFQNEDETVTIKADHVPVTLPQGDTIPMYQATGQEFSQELVTKLYDYFFPDKDSYTFEGTDFTKTKAKMRILETQEEIARTEADTEQSEEDREYKLEELRERLAMLQEEYDMAPEKSTLKQVQVDSTMKEVEYDSLEGTGTAMVLDCQSKDRKRWLYVDSHPSESDGTSSVWYAGGSEYSYSGIWGTPISEADEQQLSAIGISLEEAEQKADDLFKSIGIPAEMHDALLVAGELQPQTDEEDAPIEYADHYTAYKLVYARTVNDIEMAVTSSAYVPDDDAVQDWLYESITVIVEPSGIVNFSWNYPLDVTETVSDNVGILSFDDAADIFEQMAPLVYQGEAEQWNDGEVSCAYELNVSDVRLCLMRVRDSGQGRTGLLTPAWVFYGDANRHFHSLDAALAAENGGSGGDWTTAEEQPWILLAVNAVDGTIIDVVKGY